MLKPTTHFEQVPVEIIKKIIDEEIAPEMVTKRGPKTRRQKAEKELLGTKKKFTVSSRTPSQLELSE